MKSEIICVKANRFNCLCEELDSLGSKVTSVLALDDNRFLAVTSESSLVNCASLGLYDIKIIKCVQDKVKCFKFKECAWRESETISSGSFAVSMIFSNSPALFASELAEVGVGFMSRAFKISNEHAKSVFVWISALQE